MKKIFGNIKISYSFAIIFSIIIGIIVGILNRIPILFNTSFQDIAIYFDMWIVLALFIIINCKSYKDAMIKCFIFFLISQPLIYFTEVIIDYLFYNESFIECFNLYFKNYYIGAGWFNWTLLTIPGSFIAYYVKKDNILSALVLGVATLYLAFRASYGLISVIKIGEINHLVNYLLCLFFAFYLIFAILKNKNNRIITLVITICGLLFGIFLYFYNDTKPMLINTIVDFENDFIAETYEIDNNDVASAEIIDGGKSIDIKSGSMVGTATIIVCNKEDICYNYTVLSTSKKFDVQKQN